MIGYYLFLGFEKVLMLLPHTWRKAFFIALARLAYIVDKKHRRIVEQNLRLIYGDKISKERIEEITRYNYKNLMLNLLFTIERQHMTLEAFRDLLTLENFEQIERIQKEGRPIIFVAAHYGQWEIGASGTSAFATPLSAIYKTMSNPYFEKYLVTSRARFRMTNIPHHGALKPLIKALRKKEAIALLADTNTKERDGVVVNFLGKPTLQVTTPAMLARKFDAAIIPVSASTEDHEHYTLKLHDEITFTKTDDEDADIKVITQDIADWISQLIYDDPRPWFWLHRRWKNDYPEIYTKK